MAWTHADILTSKFNDLQVERAEITAEYERARLVEDGEALNAALDRYATNDAQLRTLNDAAMSMQRQPQPAAGFGDDVREDHVELAQRYGLSPQQIGIAVNWTTDPNMSDEVKVKRYCENVNKLSRMRQTGQYRDDQGTVKR